MPQYEISVPGRGTFRVDSPTELTDAQAYAAIRAELESADRGDKSGFIPAMEAGIAGLKGAGAALAGRAGLMDPRAAETYRAEKKAEAEAAFTPTPDGWTESPWLKFKEMAGGSLPYMGVPLAGAAAAAALPVAAPAGLLAGAGAMAAGTAMYTGTNLDRQLEEAEKAGTPMPVDKTDLGSAALAAVPQAALDVVSFRAAPLIRKLFTSVGKELTEEAAIAVAKKGFANTLKDYAVSTGKAAGTEGITESAQAFLERAQAGLKLTDPEARAEYVENFIGGAVFGTVLAPPGRYIERMGERQKAATAQRNMDERAKGAAEKTAAEQKAAERAAPGYAEDLAQRYDVVLQEKAALDARETALKAAAKTDPASKLQLRTLAEERRGFEKDRLNPVAREVAQAGGVEALKKRLPLKPEFQEGAQQAAIPGMEPAGEIPLGVGIDVDAAATGEAGVREQQRGERLRAEAAEGAQLLPRIRQAEQAVEDAQTVYSEADEATAPAARRRWGQANEQLQMLRKALAESGYKPPPAAPKAVDVEALRKQRAAMVGSPAFDPAKAGKLEDRIAAALKTNAEVSPPAELTGADSDYFAPEAKAGRVEERAQRVYGETYQGREADAALQQQEVRDTTGAAGYLESLDELPAIEQKIKDEKSEAAFERIGAQARVPPAQPDMLVAQEEAAPVRAEEANTRARKAWLRRLADVTRARGLMDPRDQALLRRIDANTDAIGVDPEFYKDVERYFTSERNFGAREGMAVVPELLRVERRLAAAEGAKTSQTAATMERNKLAALPPAQRRLLVALERPARDADPALLERIRDNVAFLAQERPEGRGRDIQAHAARYITQGPQALSVAEQVTLKQALDLADEGKTSETEVQATGEVKRTVQQELPLRQPLPGLPQTDERGARFDSFAELDKFLAGDMVQDARADAKQTGDTASRVAKLMQPLQAKMEALRVQAAEVAKMRDDALVPQQLYAEARGKLAQAEADLATLLADITEKRNDAYAKYAAAIDRHEQRREQHTQLGNAVLQTYEQAWKELSAPAARMGSEVRPAYAPHIERMKAAAKKLREAGARADKTDAALTKLIRDNIGNERWQSGQELSKAYQRLRGELKHNRALAQRYFSELAAMHKGLPSPPQLNAKALADAEAATANNLDALALLDRALGRAGPVLQRLQARFENDTRAADALVNDPDVKQRMDALREDLRQAQKMVEESSAGAIQKQLNELNQAVANMRGDISRAEYGVRERAKQAAAGRNAEGTRTAEERAKVQAERAAADRDEQVRRENADKVILDAAGEPMDRTLVKFRGRKSTEAFEKQQDETEATNVRGARRTIEEMDWDKEEAQRIKRAPLPDERGAQTTKFATAGPLTREQIMAEAPTTVRRAESTLDKDNTPAKRAAAEKLVAQYVENIRIEMDEIDARLKKFYDKRAELVTAIKTLQTELKEGPQGELLNKKELERIAKPGAKVTREKLEAPRREKFKATREAQIKTLEGKLEAHDNTLRGIYPIKVELIKLLTPDQKRALRREQLRETQNLEVGMEYADLEAEQIRYTQNEVSQLNRIDEAVVAGTLDAAGAGKARDAVYAAAKRRSTNRARGPAAREERPIPRSLRTGSPESRDPKNVTGVRRPITEKKGPEEKRYPFSGKDALEANQIASGFALARKATPAEVAAAEAREKEAAEARAKVRQVRAQSREEARTQNIADKPIKVKRRALEKVQDRAGEDFEADDDVRLSRGVEGGSPPLTDTQIASLEANELTSVLADIANDPTADAVHRAVAQQLATLLDNTDVVVSNTVTDAKGQQVLGLARSDGSEMELSRDGGLSQEVVLHEGTHAAVGRVLEIDEAKLTPVQRTAKRELEALHKAIQKDASITSVTAKTDINEFVAEALSNKVLQAQLRKIPWRISDAWAGFKSIILRLLGVPTPTNMRDAALQSIEALMAAPPAPRANLATAATGAAPTIRYAKAAKYAPGFEDVGKTAASIIGREKTGWQKLRENLLGLNFRTQLVDKLAPLEKVVFGHMESLKALQTMSYLRMYDQRMHFTAQAIANGVAQLVKKVRKDGRNEWVIESKDGVNIKDIVEILASKELSKIVGSPDAVNDLFTMYLAALRAKRVGINMLNFGKEVTQAELDAVIEKVKSTPELKEAFGKARSKYNQYNRDLLQFGVETGAFSEAYVASLVAADDYIPYYRVREGVAELMVGGETPIRIGNIKDSPHLQELVGGDEKIYDFLTSSVRNTSMLMDMSLRNLAVKNAMIGLSQTNVNGQPLAKIAQKKRAGAVPKHAVEYSDNGVEYYAIVNTDEVGVPAELLVKGLEGIPTMFPAFVRIMGGASRFLRRTVVASPIYAARQMFRDTMSATMTSGADLVPVLGALQQIGKQDVLTKRGVTGGQVFTGMPEDMTRLLEEMQRGRPGWARAFSWAEAKSMQADALTRRAQYQSYLDQGLSEMEATYMALESMNFSKRGLSPGVHFMSTLIPFLNAQIQGLDVIYKALAGKMPMDERLQIREKLVTRGLMMMGTTLAYAALMQDDEAYKNAPPEVKYGNWFMRVPGFDEAIKIPIPFEIGYIFKALPEAILNVAQDDTGAAADGALKAARAIGLQLIPGGTAFGLPQAVKPLIEAGANHSFFTGREIETPREQDVEPRARYRDTTSEIAKAVGNVFNVSPVMIEHLVRGYSGSMGMAAMQLASLALTNDGPEGAAKRLSDRPMLSTIFQGDNAQGVIDATYKRMNRAQEVKKTYESYLAKGEYAKASSYLEKNLDEMSLAPLAGAYQQSMGEITKAEAAVRASSMLPEEKRQRLDETRKLKIALSASVRAAADKNTRPDAR